MAEQASPRARQWAETMAGHPHQGLVRAHADSRATVGPAPVIGRERREEHERQWLRPGSSFAVGAGRRAIPEEPDDERTCFERDRDRIVHSTAFRRLAGKTQVVVHPSDHQRTRLTHALEVAQVATSIARGAGVNVTLADAIALGHDCGHGPGGHASEDAFDAFMPEGYEHGPWGADVVLTPLNLCAETLDGIRNHSWSRPAPQTVEGEIVSWADRIAYCAHDLEDAIHAGIVRPDDVPADVVEICGRTRREQLSTFVRAVVATITTHGAVGMAEEPGGRPGRHPRLQLRADLRPPGLARPVPGRGRGAAGAGRVLRRAAEHGSPIRADVRPGSDEAVRAAVAYVAGMTDRYAFDTAVARARLGSGPTAAGGVLIFRTDLSETQKYGRP